MVKGLLVGFLWGGTIAVSVAVVLILANSPQLDRIAADPGMPEPAPVVPASAAAADPAAVRSGPGDGAAAVETGEPGEAAVGVSSDPIGSNPVPTPTDSNGHENGEPAVIANAMTELDLVVPPESNGPGRVVTGADEPVSAAGGSDRMAPQNFPVDTEAALAPPESTLDRPVVAPIEAPVTPPSSQPQSQPQVASAIDDGVRLSVGNQLADMPGEQSPALEPALPPGLDPARETQVGEPDQTEAPVLAADADRQPAAEPTPTEQAGSQLGTASLAAQAPPPETRPLPEPAEPMLHVQAAAPIARIAPAEETLIALMDATLTRSAGEDRPGPLSIAQAPTQADTAPELPTNAAGVDLQPPPEESPDPAPLAAHTAVVASTPDVLQNAVQSEPAAPQVDITAPGAQALTVRAPISTRVAAPSAFGLPQVSGFGVTAEVPDDTSAAEPQDDNTLAALARFAATFDGDTPGPLLAIVLIAEAGQSIDPDALAALPFPVSVALSPLDPDSEVQMRALRDLGMEVLLQLDGVAGTDAELAAALEALPETVAMMDGPDGFVQRDRDAMDRVFAQMMRTGHGLVAYPRGFNTAERSASQAGLNAATLFRDIGELGDADRRRVLDRAGFSAGLEGQLIVAAPLSEASLALLVSWALGDRPETVTMAPASAVLLRD